MSRGKRTLISWGAGLTFALWGAEGLAEVTTLKYEELPARVSRDNARVQADRDRVLAAEAMTGHWGRSFLPELTALYGAEAFKLGRSSWDSQPYWSLGATLNLFRGGRDSLEERIREKGVELERAKRDATYWSELTRAREAYWRLVYLENLRRFNDEESELTRKNEQAALRRIRAGVATQTDRVEFEMHAVALKQDRARIESEVRQTLAELRTLLALPGDSDIRVEPDTTHIHDWEEILPEPAWPAQPELIQARVADEQQELQASLGKRALLPSLDLVGGWEQWSEREEAGGALDRRQAFVGAQLSWSLGQAVEGQVASRAAERRHSASHLDWAYEFREKEESLEALRSQIGLLHDQIHDALKNVERMETYFKLTLGEYARGVKNSPDVLGATERLIEFKERHAALVRDFQVSKARLIGLTARESQPTEGHTRH